jgi:tetratricopeptide (TPR) repeat protein
MLWSLSSGGLVAELSGHGGLGGNGARLCDVLSVAFSPDGSRLVTTGCDGLARVWNLSAVPHHTTGLVNFTVGGDGRLTAHGTPKRMTWKVNPDVTDLNLTAAPSQEEYERRSALTAPDPAWHAERMDEYIACSRWAPAAFHARQVAASLPWSSEAAVKLGHLRLFANQPDQAAACFARALLLDPASRMYPKSWGWVFEREGDLAAERDDWARAVRNFRAALACETSSSNWPRRKLAAALLATKDTQSLLLLCQESIVTVAKGEEDTVGIDLYLAFPIPEAEERKLVALAARWPGQMKQHSSGIINISTRTLLGAARFRAGETAEARAELAASIETDDSAIAHLFLAMTEYRLGHKEEAKRRLEEANRLPHMGSNQYDEWTLRVCWKTLRQEASELIEGKK